MLTFASLILFLGVMLGSASAQQSITCTASGELDLVPPVNAVACTLHGVIVWSVADYSSTQLVVTYENGEYQYIALSQNSTTTVCFSDVDACLTVNQGAISDNQLPVTITGYTE